MIKAMMSHLLRSKTGNVAIMSAIMAPLMLSVLGFAIDYGSLTLQKRRLQMAADMAALVAASSPNDAANAVQLYMSDNGYKVSVKVADQTNSVISDAQVDTAFSDGYRDGIALVSLGQYTPNAAILPQNRFVSTASSPNAVRVDIVQKGDLSFASAIITPPKLKVHGVAANRNETAFSIGSRLASLNGGVVNGVLGALLGSSVNLDVMDYNALATAQIDLLQFSRSLATQLKLQGVSYSKVLGTQVTWPQFLAALSDNVSDSRTKAALKDFTVSSASKLSVLPAQAINLGSYGDMVIEGVGLDSSHMEVKASLMDVVMAALTVANQNKQLNFDLDSAPLGLLAVKVQLAIGQPATTSPAVRFGQPASVVRTAQTRLNIDVSTPGLAKLLGLSVHVPVYIEAAYAQGMVSTIACSSSGTTNGTVSLQVQPGVADIYLGTVDAAHLADFSGSPHVSRADLLTLPLIKASGYAHAALTNVSPTSVSFSTDDITRGTVKAVATKNALDTLVTSALSGTDLTLSLAGLTLGTSDLLTASLQQTLKATAPIVDIVVDNLTSMLGIRIGEADVSVTGLSCNRAVLVQ